MSEETSEIERLKQENAKLRNILMHLFPEKTNRYFICGATADLDHDDLPNLIMVCPHYGLDGFAVYTKTTNYSSPDY